MNVPSNSVWTPSLSLISSASEDFFIATDSFASTFVYSNGLVGWIVPKRLVSTCKMDLSAFPFDTQTCELRFIAFSLAAPSLPAVFPQLSNVNSGIILDYYSDTGEFALLNTSTSSYSENFSNCTELIKCFPEFLIRLTYKRRSSYYIWNLLLPACFITSKYSTVCLNF